MHDVQSEKKPEISTSVTNIRGSSVPLQVQAPTHVQTLGRELAPSELALGELCPNSSSSGENRENVCSSFSLHVVMRQISRPDDWDL